MKLIKLLGYLLLIAFSVKFSYSQTVKINLRDAIRSAYKNNAAIVKDENLIESQDFNIRSSYGALFPTLTFSTGVSRTNQVSPPGVIFNSTSGGTTLGNSGNSTYNNYNLSLRSDVTLFNGFNNYDKIDVDKMTRVRYQIQLESAKQDIAVQILSDYVTVLKNQKIVEIDSATLDDSKAQLEKIKIFVEVGTKTLSDIYKQDVVVAQNELSLEQARNNVDKSIADLAFDSKLPQNKTYSIDASEFNINVTNEDLENYVTRNSNPDPLVSNALRNRYDYKASLENISILEANVEIARSALIFPTLTGFGQYQLSSQHFGDLSNSRIFTLGLTLSYTIFQGFSIENGREQAIINLRSANVDVKQLSDQITVNIIKAQYDLRSLLKQIVIADRNLKSAEQDRFSAEELYKVGRGTLLEINTSAINYNNLLITKSNLIYNFIFAQKQLEYYQGLLKY